VARRRDPDAAYIPALWLAAMLGALAGAALFGGAPLTAMFWLVLGVVASEPEPVTI
jgi:fatty acid desaturase